MDVLTISLTVLAFGGILAFVLFRLWRSAQRRETFAALWNRLEYYLPMEQVGRFMGRGHGQTGGRSWVAEITRGSRYTPAYLHVRLALSHFADRAPLVDEAGRAVRGPAGAKLRRRTWWDRIGAKLGLERRISTGDAAFDAAVLVESHASDRVLRALFAGEPARRAVLDLLDAGARSITVLVAAPFATASWRNPGVEQAGRAMESAQALSTIADAIPVVAGDVIQRGRGLGAAWVPIVWASLGMIGLFGYIQLAGAHPFVGEADGTLVGIGLLLFLPACLASYLMLRGRTGGLALFTFAAPAALLGLVFGTLAFGHLANQASAPGEDTWHDVRIASVHQYSSRSFDDHDLEVRVNSWLPAGRDILITVRPKGIPYVVGGHARVVSRPGRLGWDWVVSAEALPAEKAISPTGAASPAGSAQ